MYVCLYVLGELDCIVVSYRQVIVASSCVIPVSPASPEKAIKVCVLSTRVLSSDALRMVAPRMAALEAAMRVKSLPVIPSRTSLYSGQYWSRRRQGDLHCDELEVVTVSVLEGDFRRAWRVWWEGV